jgi:hypothetical protein
MVSASVVNVCVMLAFKVLIARAKMKPGRTVIVVQTIAVAHMLPVQLVNMAFVWWVNVIVTLDLPGHHAKRCYRYVAHAIVRIVVFVVTENVFATWDTLVQLANWKRNARWIVMAMDCATMDNAIVILDLQVSYARRKLGVSAKTAVPLMDVATWVNVGVNQVTKVMTVLKWTILIFQWKANNHVHQVVQTFTLVKVLGQSHQGQNMGRHITLWKFGN